MSHHYSHRGQKEDIEKQSEAEVVKKKQFLATILEALRKNLLLLEQMERELVPEFVAFYNVDINLLELIASIKYEIIDDAEINSLLNTVRYELAHLHRKVELQLEIEFSAYRTLGDYMKKRTQLIDAIRAHISPIKGQINRLIEIISKQI